MAEDDFPSLGAAPAKKQAPQQAKPKKQKGKTLALDDWLQEETAGSGSCKPPFHLLLVLVSGVQGRRKLSSR